ncbi:MAG TPA: M20 family metallopeptidase [Holophaga sp.]|nr:M20 family metallopeptidase [Holophaga sp.]
MPLRPDFPHELSARLIEWRRALHRCPEVGLDLPVTLAYLERELRRLDLQPRTVGKGLVVDIGPAGPRIAWRADMDALPIEEETALPFASEHRGAMHACGHDAHMAAGLGLAWALSILEDPPAARIIFQPDEEGRFGAEPLIEAGVLDDVAAIIGVHVGHLHEQLRPGQFAVRAGAQMAASDRFRAVFRGQGTHGAQPHLGRDPLVAAAQFVGAVQTLRGREIQPGHLALISVGRLQAGHAANVVPESAELAGIIRTEHTEDRERLAQRTGDVARGIAMACGVDVDWERIPTCPPVHNHPSWTRRAREAVLRLLGPEALLEMDSPSPTADDIAFYLERVPGVYLFLGTNDPRKGISEPNHSPRFDVDETQLWKAVALGVEIIREGAWPDLRSDYQL